MPLGIVAQPAMCGPSSKVGVVTELSIADLLELFGTIVGRAPEDGELEDLHRYVVGSELTPLQARAVLSARADVVAKDLSKAEELHLFAIHLARVKLISTMLPPARRIVDLGGANAPLCDTGYPYPFDELTVVDLPPDARHEVFADRLIEARQTAQGKVSVLYTPMSDLSAIADCSVDLVWSGQSIEHIEPDVARTVYKEVRRILQPGGWFCLDTPNALLTRVHSPAGFIHPDHKVEYTPRELVADLEQAGFHVIRSLGVCEMPLTMSAGRIDYRDFLVGAGISEAVERSYIQFHACQVSAASNVAGVEDAMPHPPIGSDLVIGASDPRAAVDALLQRVSEVLDDHRDDRLDEYLVSAFRRLVSDGDWLPGDVAALQQRIGALPDILSRSVRAPSSSRIPGGSLAHRAVGKATRRQDDALINEVGRFAEEVRSCLLDVVNLVSSGQAAGSHLLAIEAEATSEGPTSAEHMVALLDERLTDLDGRLARLENNQHDREFRPWFSELDFGEAFRGTRNEILDRYHPIADILAAGGGPVLDLGCGRGEIVELLAARQTEARGVEIDSDLVEFCRSVHLDVRLADAASALEGEADGSLGGVALIQVVEHLTAQQLVELVPLIGRKLRPGGVAVVETVNGTSPFVYTRSFYIDPTHTTPVHPAYLQFLFDRCGFSRNELIFRSPVPSDQMIPLVAEDGDGGGLPAQVNKSIETANRFLFGAQDYAVVATR